MIQKSILLLHGWGLSANKYKNLINRFKRVDYKIYCPDLPGFGKNKKLEKNFTLSDYVRFVKSYLKSRGIDHVVVIGHSFGGRIALKLAAEYPNIVDGLILTGVPGFQTASKVKLIFFMFISKIGCFFFSLPILSRIKLVMRKVLYRIIDEYDYLKTDNYLKETFKSVIREELVSYMKKIRIKTFLVWGDQDKIVPLKIAKQMNKAVKNSQLIIISNSDHSLPYKNPGKFFNAIVKYL